MSTRVSFHRNAALRRAYSWQGPSPASHLPTPAMSSPAVDLRNLTKRFGPITAVRDLTLRIESGEIVAFLGPNGAGKTTTIDMLLGLTRPDAGTVQVYGRTSAEAIARGEIAAVM